MAAHVWDDGPMQTHTGRLDASGLRVAIVASRFNDLVVKRLVEGAVEALVRAGASEDDVTVAWVPGAFEIPVVARELAESGNADCVVCLGVVVRGETAHFDFVAGPVASAIADIAQSSGVPVGFGVLTTETMEQALDRAGGKAGNKGAEAALAAVETLSLLRSLRRPRAARKSRSS